MRPNQQETADFVTFTEEFHNGKLHFLYSEPDTGVKTQAKTCSKAIMMPRARNVFDFCSVDVAVDR